MTEPSGDAMTDLKPDKRKLMKHVGNSHPIFKQIEMNKTPQHYHFSYEGTKSILTDGIKHFKKVYIISQVCNTSSMGTQQIDLSQTQINVQVQ